jgi:Rod binding domain-containing protein
MNLKVTNEAKHFTSTPEVTDKYTAEQKTKLAKASRDFEGLLSSMMLKSMTKNTEGLFGGEEGLGSDMYQSMFENEISSMISKSKGLGVAEELYKKLTGEDLPADVVERLLIWKKILKRLRMAKIRRVAVLM